MSNRANVLPIPLLDSIAKRANLTLEDEWRQFDIEDAKRPRITAPIVSAVLRAYYHERYSALPEQQSVAGVVAGEAGKTAP